MDSYMIPVPEFLSGGGEMGKLIRSKDWSKTPLGLPDSWPQSLRTTVSLCIASNFPISIAWGPHRVQIYNDGYWPITGDMHPTSMGQDFKECWISAWPVIGQAFEEASLGQTRFLENQRIFLERYGYLEETFFTFSFSPILDESGGVGGLFHPVLELTHQTLAERRLNILRAVADNTVNAKTTKEASSLILACLKDFAMDLPFVLLYSIADDGKEANLEGSVGVNRDSPIAQVKINLQVDQSNCWPFTEVIQKGKAILVEEPAKIFGTFVCGPYPEPPHQALVFPMTLPGTDHNKYVLVAAVSSRRILDEKYLLFYEFLTASITNALTKARAYEEERKKAEALAAIDKAKTVFFSNISHEFRTPLTLILGSLEELLNKNNSEVIVFDKEAIETSHRNAMRLLRLVNNLLDFSRIEAGRIQAQYQLTDLAKYTIELASNFRSVIEKAGLTFEVTTDAVIHPVYIDKQMWEKIVLNLLSNAYKFTLKGSITLLLTSENNKIVLKVKDTGVGIPENELPKMFQRFHRVQNVVGRTYEGTGIGLSLVSELVKLHGGEISVQSTEAEGSEFTVSIPTGKSHLPREHVIEKDTDFKASLSDAFIDEASTLIDHNVLTGKGSEFLKKNRDAATILVVDDNADMRAYIKKLLQKQYHVVTANNGMDALLQIQEHSPQLIVSDIMMPVMDGIQLLKAVKENPQIKNIPLILLSARAGEDAKIEGYETGADDYLVKPFSAKELVARVASQLKLVALHQAAETHVRNLFMQAPAIICVLHGPHHIYQLANAMYMQLIGHRNVVGKTIREALPELEGTGFFELLDEVYKTGEPFIANEMPVTLQKANGVFEESILNFIYQASRNVQGEIDGILVHGIEVTDQVFARKKIEESETKFRTLTQSLPQIIWTTDKNGTVGFFNQQWYDYTGSNPEQSFGNNWTHYIHPQQLETLWAKWQHSLQSGGPIEVEFQLRAKDGSYKWFYVVGNSLKDESGTIYKWLGTLTEIDERKKWEEVLKESEERFRDLADESPIFVFIIEPDPLASVSYWNKTWLDFTGQNLKEAKGRAWERIIHPDDIPIVMDVYLSAFINKQPYFIPAVRTKRNDGEYRWHAFKANPRYLADGSFNGYVGVGFDVHEQRITEERLEFLVNERTKELQHSNEDLQQFAHVASHDLKEPVRKIRIFGSRLSQEFGEALSEKAKIYLKKMESAADRMYAMIDGVLMYSSLDALHQNEEPIDLNNVLNDIESDLEILIAEKNANIRYEDLHTIVGSPILIYQLFYNLINNSLKFSKSDLNPLVEITSEIANVKDLLVHGIGGNHENFVKIIVKDNGIGFSSSESEKIFKTFFRLHPKDQYEGTGLGLALCKKIVERHGGAIAAKGIEDEGAIFEIILPNR